MATKAAFRWNSGAGEQTLTGASAICRFNGWRRDPHTVGEQAIAWGDGRGYQWPGRDDYTASMTLPHIANADEALVSQFLLWVNAFGLFSIDTADSEDNSYEECQIAPGSRAEVSEPDPETLDLAVSLTALNIAVAPIPLRCLY